METIKSVMNKIEEHNLPPTLKQGLKFKKYQKDIKTNPRTVAIANDLEEKETTTIQGFNNSLNEENEESAPVEGFTTQTSTMSKTIMTPSTPVSQEILSQLSELDKLQTQYDSLIEKYNTVNNSSADKIKTKLTNITNNPYANKNVTLSDGKTYYVTSKGTSKLYDSSATYNATNGQNNCPSGSTSLNLRSLSDVTTSGSNMVSGQSCGNEGSSVFVNKTLNTPTSEYIGCYNDSTTSPSMTSVNNGSKIYNYASCQEAAVNSGSSYFGLQGLDSTTNLSSCYISNDLATAQKYKVAKTMCNTDSNGYVYGNTLVNAIYKSPNGTATYVNTYKDSPSRAMTLVNGGSGTFTYESCKNHAMNTGNTFFALQNFNSKNQTAQCAVSNDFTKASQYGIKKNSSYIGKDKKTYGGGWANAIYQLESDLSNYKGCYNDRADKPAMTSLGSGKSTYSFSTCKDEAVKNGYGYFALQGIGSGSSKCFASNDLSSAKIYGEAKTCSKSLDGKNYGNNGINAIYKMNELGDASSVGKMGYVDYNSNVTEFPDSMTGLSLTYEKYSNYGTTLASTNTLQNATYDTAVAKCNGSSSCYGFTLDSSTNVATFYGKDIINPSNRILKPNTTLYVRNKMLQNLNSACNKQVVNIDSSQWKNYVKKSGYMSPSSTCDLSTAIMSASSQSNEIQASIVSTAKEMIKILNNLNKKSMSINNTTGLNSKTIEANIQKYNDVIAEMSEFTDIRENNISNIVKESDIKVLQENYGYMFWSILAIATVIVTMNIMRK